MWRNGLDRCRMRYADSLVGSSMNRADGHWLWPAGAALLFSGSYIAGRITTAELTPLTASLLRYIAGFAFLAALAAWPRRRAERLSAGDHGLLLLAGVTGVSLYQFLFFAALRHTAVAHTAIINALSPIVTAVFAAVCIRERLTARNYAGVAIAVAGVLLLLSRGSPARLLAQPVNRGDLFMLLAVVAWAAYALMVRRLSARLDGWTITFASTGYGLLFLALAAVAADDVAGQVRTLSPVGWAAILYMGVGTSGLGYLLYNRAIALSGPTRTAGVVYSLVPLGVAALAWAWFGEPVTGIMAGSTVLILAGLYLQQARR
jgi:drug/metabolite transporter (DMT)-like permease